MRTLTVLKENVQMRTGRGYPYMVVSPAPALLVYGAQRRETINGDQRVNRDFTLVLYSFVKERCRHVREAKEETRGRIHG